MDLESLHVQREAGVEVIVAIDSTVRGPALGGCHWRPYQSVETARRDAAGLARVTTRRAALARLSHGGGKTVVIGDPRERTTKQLLMLGDFVDALEGRYIVAADTGVGEEEMAVIAERTGFVVGLPDHLGGCGGPGPYTAQGVHLAMQAALGHRGQSLEGARVAIQGVGTVGSCLVEHLLESGARPIVADTMPEALSDLPEGVEVVAPDAILTVECDVFSPCGPAGVIDAQVAEQVCCHVVCGSANDPLEHIGIGSLLEHRGIFYVPDFLANAGGLIHLAAALEGGDGEDSQRRLGIIPENLERVMAYASAQRVSTAVAAERLASAAIAGVDDA